MSDWVKLLRANICKRMDEWPISLLTVCPYSWQLVLELIPSSLASFLSQQFSSSLTFCLSLALFTSSSLVPRNRSELCLVIMWVIWLPGLFGLGHCTGSRKQQWCIYKSWWMCRLSLWVISISTSQPLYHLWRRLWPASPSCVVIVMVHVSAPD